MPSPTYDTRPDEWVPLRVPMKSSFMKREHPRDLFAIWAAVNRTRGASQRTVAELHFSDITPQAFKKRLDRDQLDPTFAHKLAEVIGADFDKTFIGDSQ